jgi:pimeloyl-ACP methyl ester carboxylesterase
MTRAEYEKLPAESRTFSMLRLLSGSRQRGLPLLSDDELDYYVRAFEQTGFSGAINWYRNFSHNWQTLEGYEERIRVPTLFIGAIDDLVVDLAHIDPMKPFVDDLELHMLEDCGHWTQQEKPDDVNRLMLDWLSRPLRGERDVSSTEVKRSDSD